MGSEDEKRAYDAHDQGINDAKIEELAGENDIDFGDSTYQRKARVLNAAIQETGMGRYQWWARLTAAGLCLTNM